MNFNPSYWTYQLVSLLLNSCTWRSTGTCFYFLICTRTRQTWALITAERVSLVIKERDSERDTNNLYLYPLTLQTHTICLCTCSEKTEQKKTEDLQIHLWSGGEWNNIRAQSFRAHFIALQRGVSLWEMKSLIEVDITMKRQLTSFTCQWIIKEV